MRPFVHRSTSPAHIPRARLWRILPCLALALALGAVLPARGAPVGVQVTVVGSAQKIRPTDHPTGTQSAQLVAAQNEFESFQIAVSATGSAITGLSVRLGAPPTGAGGSIPAENITIYREAYYVTQTPSNQGGAPTGAWPDALIPAVDPFYHHARKAFPIDVPAGENRVAWIDVQVPQAAKPGSYDGTLLVTAQNLNVIVPVHLTVLPFALPSTSTLASAFEINWNDACQVTYGGNCWQAPATEADGWRLNALYARAALDNRITIPAPQYQPVISQGELDLFREYMLPLVKGTSSSHSELKPRLPGARLTVVQVDNGPGGQLAAWKAEAERQGFADRAFVYACDEPNSDQQVWDRCKQNADAARAVWPDVRILITSDIQNASKFGGTDYINLMTPVLNAIDDKPGSDSAGNQRPRYDAFLKSNPRNQLWLYTSCMSHGCDTGGECVSDGGAGTTDPYFQGWAGYMLDAPASQARAMGWMAFEYNTSGELYFLVSHCLQTAWDKQYAFGGNGDGTLFYPWREDLVGGDVSDAIPIESIRLKLIRDGYEDYEYLHRLAAQGQGDQAQAIARELFANPYTTTRTDADIQAARLELVGLLAPAPKTTPRVLLPVVAS